jgi:hypothetical protein
VAHADQEVAFAPPGLLQLPGHLVEGHRHLDDLVLALYRSARCEVASGQPARSRAQALQPPPQEPGEPPGGHRGQEHPQPQAPEQACRHRRPGHQLQIGADDHHHLAQGPHLHRQGEGGHRLAIHLRLELGPLPEDGRPAGDLLGQRGLVAHHRDPARGPHQHRLHVVVAPHGLDYPQQAPQAAQRSLAHHAPLAHRALDEPGGGLGLAGELAARGILDGVVDEDRGREAAGGQGHHRNQHQRPEEASAHAQPAIRYPMPQAVSMGTPSSFLRNCRTWTSTVRVSPK